MDEQRAEFEAWANDAGFNINRQDNDNYLYSATRGAWEAWQAATQRQQERIAELLAVVIHARNVLPNEPWADDTRKMLDAAIARATHKEQT